MTTEKGREEVAKSFSRQNLTTQQILGTERDREWEKKMEKEKGGRRRGRRRGMLSETTRFYPQLSWFSAHKRRGETWDKCNDVSRQSNFTTLDAIICSLDGATPRALLFSLFTISSVNHSIIFSVQST